MASNPVWKICERMAEVQALVLDHAECGMHTAADVVAMAQAVVSEPELLRATFDVGYFSAEHAAGMKRTCSVHRCVDEQDYDGGTQNDSPIGHLNAGYRCFLAKPFHDFPPN